MDGWVGGWRTGTRIGGARHDRPPPPPPFPCHFFLPYLPSPFPPADLERQATGGPRVPSIRSELRAAFSAAIAAAFPDLAPGAPPTAALEATREAKHGDYQCNAAMGLFGRGKGTPGFPAKSPRDVAAAIVAALPPTPLLDGTPDLAGPGFINCRIDRPALAARVKAMLVAGPATWAPTLGAARAVVDFSSPNVAKEMHVGHLRSTIIGDTIARTLEFCGVDTLRLNHVGDWGTQFGMLIQHMAETHAGGLDAVGDADVGDLQVLYKAAKKRFDAEEDFKARAREAVTRLQGGDPAATAAWKTICAASRREFEAIYDRLGVSLTERGESFYNPLLADLVRDMEAAGVAVEDGGAKVVWVEGQDHPLIVQKSDGGFGYATTDLAALRQRVGDERADWIIYVTDAGQATHFRMVFAAAERAGFIPPQAATSAGAAKKKGGAEAAPAAVPAPAAAAAAALPPTRIDHVGFGLVLGSDGKRIRTRDEGAAVRLVELLDEAVARAEAAIRARDASADGAGVAAAAKAMGFAAVKYADLKNNRTTDYKFDFDAMLALQGDTAVYLLYAHARIAAIARKAGKDVAALARDPACPIVLGTDAEAALALHLTRFTEAIEDMAADLAPNRLTEYLYALAEAFNAFYTECKVIGDPAEGSRLQLAEATAVVMRAVMGLLGITPLYRL